MEALSMVSKVLIYGKKGSIKRGLVLQLENARRSHAT